MSLPKPATDQPMISRHCNWAFGCWWLVHLMQSLIGSSTVSAVHLHGRLNQYESHIDLSLLSHVRRRDPTVCHARLSTGKVNWVLIFRTRGMSWTNLLTFTNVQKAPASSPSWWLVRCILPTSKSCSIAKRLTPTNSLQIDPKTVMKWKI